MSLPLPDAPPGAYDFYVTKRGAVWRTKVRNGDEQCWIPLRSFWLAQALRDCVIGRGKGDHGVALPEIARYLSGVVRDAGYAKESLDRIAREHRRKP